MNDKNSTTTELLDTTIDHTVTEDIKNEVLDEKVNKGKRLDLINDSKETLVSGSHKLDETEEETHEDEEIIHNTIEDNEEDYLRTRNEEDAIAIEEQLSIRQDNQNRSKNSTLFEFLSNTINSKSKTISSQLKELLEGVLILNVIDTKKCFKFEWKNEQYQVQEMEFKGIETNFSSKETLQDCTISLSDRNLRDIVDGILNPQLAIISGKTAVTGKFSIAIYFFNLIVP